MRRSLVLLTVAVSPFAASSTSVIAKSTAHPSLAIQLANRMVQALDAQSRIVVRGSARGPGKLSTRYVMRYLARGREFLSQTGGPWGEVRVQGKSVEGVSSIYIGRQAYTSMDREHWYRTTRPSAPRPLDALSLNIANAPCCVANARGRAVKLSIQGTEVWHRTRVQILGFNCEAEGYVLTGHVLVDPRTHLPLHYTQTSRTPAMSGAFTISYGGSFSITAPR